MDDLHKCELNAAVDESEDCRWFTTHLIPSMCPLPARIGAAYADLACGRRTHAATPMSLRFAIHRLASANSGCNCAVFLASPQ